MLYKKDTTAPKVRVVYLKFPALVLTPDSVGDSPCRAHFSAFNSMSDADFPSLSNLHIDGLTIFYSTIAVVLQSVFFGASTKQLSYRTRSTAFIGIHLLIMPLGLYIVMYVLYLTFLIRV